MVVTGDDEDACHCHNHKRYGVAATENEEHDGKQNGKTHRCHRHKADGEQNGYKNGKTDQSCAPINKPHAGEEGQHRFSPFKSIPHGECVPKHTTKECGSRAELCGSVKVSHNKVCYKYWENGLANINGKHAKGCGGKAVETFEVGKARILTAKLADVLFIHQAREDDRAVYSTKQICHYGKGKAI